MALPRLAGGLRCEAQIVARRAEAAVRYVVSLGRRNFIDRLMAAIAFAPPRAALGLVGARTRCAQIAGVPERCWRALLPRQCRRELPPGRRVNAGQRLQHCRVWLGSSEAPNVQCSSPPILPSPLCRFARIGTSARRTGRCCRPRPGQAAEPSIMVPLAMKGIVGCLEAPSSCDYSASRRALCFLDPLAGRWRDNALNSIEMRAAATYTP